LQFYLSLKQTTSLPEVAVVLITVEFVAAAVVMGHLFLAPALHIIPNAAGPNPFNQT
jgi:hypothetical protein